jgi:hypothetical protein
MATEYEIGTAPGSMTNLRDLPVPLYEPEPGSGVSEWSRTYFRGDGLRAGDGFPTNVWRFTMLTQEMVNQLRQFCPGISASVYLRTLNPDGTWATYSAVMDWDEKQMEKRRWGGRYWGVEIVFRKLVAW